MSHSDIKNYINRALALEKAVFIQEALIKEHTKLLESKRISLEKDLKLLPRKPVKHTVMKEHIMKKKVDPKNYTVNVPLPPKKPIWDWKVIRNNTIIGAFALIFAIFSFFIFFANSEFPALFASLVCLFIVFLCFYNIFVPHITYPYKISEYENKKKYCLKLIEQKKRDYEAEVARQEQIYANSLEGAERRYKRNLEKADFDYKIALERYSTDMNSYTLRKTALDKFNNSSASILHEQSKLLNKLKLALKEHYSSNILYPKYQYFVAVASISEYLSSGRCDTLEGANGAYNIYESELRQNLVISQLSSILGDINQVKTNQYLLYNELMDAENTVKELSKSRLLTPIGINDPMYDNYVASTLKFIES